jgi:hypothetical protein
MLDKWGAPERSHREIARWVAQQQGIHPLAWNAQAIAGSYERSHGLHQVGEKDDGFAITASRTVPRSTNSCAGPVFRPCSRSATRTATGSRSSKPPAEVVEAAG